MATALHPSEVDSDEPLTHWQRSHARMLAALNHEIRTPLTGILGMSDLLLESSLSAEQREYVQSTRLCAENLLESLSNALEYAAVTGGQLRLADAPFELQEAIRASVAGMQSRAESRGLLIQLLSDPSDSLAPLAVNGDCVRLRQVITILLSHAISVCVQDEIPVAVSTFHCEHDSHLTLTLSVNDNGPDVAPGRVQQLFAPPDTEGFTHARMELGLPLAFRLVEAMGGTLEAEAISGAGLMFTLTLPLPIQDATIDGGQRHQSVQPVRRQILLVEDNDVAQRFMKTVLERKGYSVTVAGSGVEAIAAVESACFDLILMDVQMPEMDGLECTRRIRRNPRGANVPIVACTANTAAEVRTGCIESGMDDFLAKPVHTVELAEIVAKYVTAA